jgi:CRP-like cAMP-binding protein
VAITRADLAALPIFRDMSPDALAALARRGAEVRYPADAVIFRAGDQPRGWYVVLEGHVRVVRGTDARQHVIHSEGPGGTLGEVPLFAGDTHPATGIAAEPTRCALFDRPAIVAAMGEYPDIGMLISRRLAERVRLLVARLDDRSRGVRARLVEYLLKRLAMNRTSGRVSLGLTQQALAEELGTVREVVARELKALAGQGLLEPLGGGRYGVPNPGALREIANN